MGKARGPLYVYISTEVYQIKSKTETSNEKKVSESCLEAVWTCSCLANEPSTS